MRNHITQVLLLVAAGAIGGLVVRWTPGPQIAAAADRLPWSGRGYYLTKEKVQGDKALSACASGFHMAHMAEILNPSVLAYDVKLGYTTDDSGFGPPSGAGPVGSEGEGWIRTGNASSNYFATGGGLANCSAWTANATNGGGTIVAFGNYWGVPIVRVPPTPTTIIPSPIDPWRTRPVEQNQQAPCSRPQRVWCVQNGS